MRAMTCARLQSLQSLHGECVRVCDMYVHVCVRCRLMCPGSTLTFSLTMTHVCSTLVQSTVQDVCSQVRCTY